MFNTDMKEQSCTDVKERSRANMKEQLRANTAERCTDFSQSTAVLN